MGAAFFPILFFTAFWAAVGIGLPMMTPRGPNQGLIRCVLVLTAATCWIFWLCCYMAQMNPLIGPKLNQHAIMMIAKNWGEKLAEG